MLALVTIGTVPSLDPWEASRAVDGMSEPASARAAHEVDPADLDAVVDAYCVRCHSDRRLTGGLSLEGFRLDAVTDDAERGEAVIRKLRAGMMPPPGARRPPADTALALMEEMEERLDRAAAQAPNPGIRPFQRLNRAEYEAAVKDLLDLDIDAGLFLPLDTKSANFDNIADVQLLSASVLDAYLRAADEVSRLAVGSREPGPTSVTYSNSGYVSQWDRVPGAPRGTRGGLSVVHNFPADGDYRIRLWFEHTTMGEMFGRITPGEQIDVSVDGVQVALIHVDRWLSTSDPNSASMETEPVFIQGGPRRISAAFIKTADGPVEDLTSPFEWSLVDRQVGVNGYGITAFAHIKDLVILGPYNASPMSVETPSRRRIFSCRPATPVAERPCAEEIVGRLARRAFRGPVSEAALETLMGLYDEGARNGGFEEGVRTAVQGILAMPDFVFRIEEGLPTEDSASNQRLSDEALASRLSFFLWAGPPDDELLRAAAAGRLTEPGGLEEQTRRMLAHPKASALATRFASQWLRLEDLEKVHPDRLLFPDFYEQLKMDMLRETEALVTYIVQNDRSVFDLYDADYTFLNERLALHYGIDGVVGRDFRRVEYPDSRRAGVLGHGSVLTLTSHAGRTSPVLRGKWVMEVLLGTPPPPPPPNVPDLEEVAGAAGGRLLTTGERMALHRANPSCASCHNVIDPIGLALDNFEVTGQWRIRENGAPLDTRGEFYDGSLIDSPEDLRAALLRRPAPILRNFTANLMAYALGRRVEYFDQPAIRDVVRKAEARDHRFSEYVIGIVRTDAFQQRLADVSMTGAERRE
jgi:mono/diheme cytochrome c family protein